MSVLILVLLLGPTEKPTSTSTSNPTGFDLMPNVGRSNL